MTTQMSGALLDMERIAVMANIKPDSIRRLHKKSMQRRRDGTTRPGDMPEPTARLTGRPLWDAAAISEWLTNRPRAGKNYAPDRSVTNGC